MAVLPTDDDVDSLVEDVILTRSIYCYGRRVVQTKCQSQAARLTMMLRTSQLGNSYVYIGIFPPSLLRGAPVVEGLLNTSLNCSQTVCSYAKLFIGATERKLVCK